MHTETFGCQVVAPGCRRLRQPRRKMIASRATGRHSPTNKAHASHWRKLATAERPEATARVIRASLASGKGITLSFEIPHKSEIPTNRNPAFFRRGTANL